MKQRARGQHSVIYYIASSDALHKALFELASGSTISTGKGSKISPNCTNRTTVRTRFLLTSGGPLTAAIARMLLLLVYLNGSTNVPPEIQLVPLVLFEYLLLKSTILYRTISKVINKLRKFQSNIYRLSYVICTSLYKIIDLYRLFELCDM